MTKRPASDEKPAHVRLRDLTGDDRPIAATGRSVGEWITTFRIARARALLRTTELSIDDVAVEVGWSDATHFIRTFSREEGRTPSAFRRAVTQRRDASRS
jgi:transcriptional regulator GlxA family with amidase domain